MKTTSEMETYNDKPTPQQKAERERSISVTLIIIIIAVALLALIGFLFVNRHEEMLEGQAEATSVRISGKLPGRVVRFYVEEGQPVNKGDTLVHIHSSLAEARLYQAEAMQEVASAQNSKIDQGTRSQIIQGAYELWQQAKAARVIAEKTYNRMEALYKQDVVSEQKRDEAQAAFTATKAAEKAAESQYNLAKEGAQKQDKQSASALVDAAKGSVMEVEALLQDQYLTAPCDGEIDVIYPEESELVAMGAPIMSLLKTDDKFVTFNVRETLLADMPIGKQIDIFIPALDKRVKAKIYYVRDLGTYATWRATKATGQWDSRTFQVKVRPEEQIPELRPGMTVIFDK
ncbi:MAG: HlyD family efflux transporter periplasmic adaptor subunit [Muribaculum sp.]|nr:HlyD family efflux transporter periplasmic adaptor subunit [Muribaculaceae bacterium]MCM1081796.1 HlyD family efflux transporter periplasmic adaptor subunit [Muribaculum sp.]